MSYVQWFFAPERDDAFGMPCDVSGCRVLRHVVFLPQWVSLCRDHYQEMASALLASLHCSYCQNNHDLAQCASCGAACCHDHTYVMDEEIAAIYGVSLPAVECVSCACK